MVCILWKARFTRRYLILDTLNSKSDSLNYCYYVYKINVTNYDVDDEGRMDGQLLAQEFVAPHIISNDYDLFVDVHSNKGMISGTYEETNFVFAVGQDEKSEAFVNKILNKMPEKSPLYHIAYRASGNSNCKL